jgi:hypothetical protein
MTLVAMKRIDWSVTCFDRLRHRYPDVPEDFVHEIVDSARRRFDQAPIRDFVPLFVERHTKEKLETLVTSAGPA